MNATAQQELFQADRYALSRTTEFDARPNVEIASDAVLRLKVAVTAVEAAPSTSSRDWALADFLEFLPIGVITMVAVLLGVLIGHFS